jgi:hypothetical protein
MRIVLAALMALFVSGAAYAQQQQPVPRYGEEDKAKSPAQIEADKAAERAYQRSLGAIPDKGASDPWGAVRTDAPKSSAAKTKTKTGAAPAKSGNAN